MKKPKIRFKGYTEDWEQHKLGDTVEFLDTQRKPLEGAKRISGPYPYYGASGIVDYVNDYLFDEELVLLSEDGANITDRNYPVSFLASGKYWVNNHAHVLKTKEDCENNFICNSLERKNYAQYNSGMAMPKLNQATCRNIPIACPEYEEQRKIGDYFRSLDHLITLHQRKCDETKKLKKYMLQKMFPKDGENVPEIRFRGYTDAWEQRRLGEITDRVTRKNQDLVSTLPLTISAQYGLIDQNDFFEKRVASKDISNYYLVNKGEFAYNKSTSNDAPWGAIKRLDWYENGVLSTLYIVFRICNEEETNSDYLVAYYDTVLWHKGIHEIAAEGARNHGLLNIAPSDFFNTYLAIPQDIEEQKKIGDYFKHLDHLITLHQRECIMFYYNRKYAWEQRKLGEIASLITKGTTPKDKSGIGEVNFIKVENINSDNGEITGMTQISSVEHEGYLKRSQLMENDILFSIAGTLGRATIVKSDILPANTNQALAIIRTKQGCLTYLLTALKGKAVEDFIKRNPTVGAQPNLSLEQVGNLEIPYPSDEEQKLIGAYFSTLAHLLTLHHLKCNYTRYDKEYAENV